MLSGLLTITTRYYAYRWFEFNKKWVDIEKCDLSCKRFPVHRHAFNNGCPHLVDGNSFSIGLFGCLKH